MEATSFGTRVENFIASEQPVRDLRTVAYPGQSPRHYMYRKGYEPFFNSLRKLNEGTPGMMADLLHNTTMLRNLAAQLRQDSYFYSGIMIPEPGEFIRTILGMETPIPVMGGYKEGAEVLVASWGHGKTSPVHGHNAGMLYENILFGKMKVNTYQMTTPTSNVVRLIRTDIVGPGEFVAKYEPANPKNHFKRQALIHNFTSIGASASLHFVPEHTRDGRDNRFEVEYFEDRINLTTADVIQITPKEGMYLQVGDVVMVRSSNVPEYGDHYIVITGHPVPKPHGIRPQDVALAASPKGISLLDVYEPTLGVTLLKLKNEARNMFLNFHNIEWLEDQKLINFPHA